MHYWVSWPHPYRKRLPMGLSEQDRIITGYMNQSAKISKTLMGSLTRQWRALTGWRDGDVGPFLDQILPLINAGMSQHAALTDAYLSLMLTDQTGKSHPPTGVPPLTNIRGVPEADVYTRPFKTTRAAIGEGLDLQAAAKLGLERLTDITLSDLQLARRKTSHDILSRSGVAGYRRVISGAENCGMCLVASTQRYHRGDLLPIHPGCDCGVAPISGTSDPGQIIDAERLEGTHAAIAERFGPEAADRGARNIDYRKVVVVQEHGELGPVLTVKGQHFTSASSVA